ncbi:PilZ domain-containing protein [Caulobacter sp. 1776]|uniref:PilZ domain-containing protein n=1 Tax=Caulobacter sp. 1776 TaxID=3156420 RepID=UPI003396E43C
MTSTLDSSADGADRRAHPRYLDHRSVYVGDGAIARKCAFVDISEGGARISVGKGASLPSNVVLVDPATGFSRRAAVVWRTKTEIGVRFVQEGVRYRVLRSANDLGCYVERPARRWAS